MKPSILFAQVGIFGGALVVASLVGAQNAASPSAKTTEQAFKNIQTLKGIPADQLIPTMQFIANSLGVDCEYCHVHGAFDKDDKKPKQTARKMMEMMSAINSSHFEGHREVTCYSCHHGNAHPIGIPLIAAATVPPAHLEPSKAADAKGPGDQKAENQKTEDQQAAIDPAVEKSAIDKTLEKYVAALGGAGAIQKVSSRIEKGSADLGGRTFPVDIFVESPSKRSSVMHLPNGNSVTACNEDAGWMISPDRPLQFMSQPETEAYQFDADLHLPLRLKEIFSEFHLLPPQAVDGHPATVVQAIHPGRPPVEFYFDDQSGLLVRLVRYIDTPLGLNPTQINYADYREIGGVKTPYRWTIARPRGQFTIQLDQVQQNVAIPKETFVVPEQKPPSQ